MTDTKKETPAKPTASNPIPVADHDRVVMASRSADGTPDQTPDFEYIGDYETTEKANVQQLQEQAVSAQDVAIRGVTDEQLAASVGATEDGKPSPVSGKPDPVVAPIVEAHEAAAKAAESAAKAEVKEHHKGLGDK